MNGTVYLVGAGPGAADLITLRAAKLLAEADVVFHDALVPPGILELSRGEKIPVGKRHGRHSTAQRFINKRLADAARRHRVVVRLKGGDPMLFGRAQEEIDHLNSENIPVEIVPGVTAASGAAAQLACSLTLRGVSRSIVFATPRAGEDESRSTWARAVAAADTAALYMAAHDAESVLRELLEHGVRGETPIVLVENATVADERILSGCLRDLPRLAASLAGGAALILLGEVFREAAAAEPSSEARSVAGAQSGWRGSSWWGD